MVNLPSNIIKKFHFNIPVRLHSVKSNLLKFHLCYTGRFIMYSGITKIYYRKTVGYVFMKPVQTEGTSQFFPIRVFLRSSHF